MFEKYIGMKNHSYISNLVNRSKKSPSFRNSLLPKLTLMALRAFCIWRMRLRLLWLRLSSGVILAYLERAASAHLARILFSLNCSVISGSSCNVRIEPMLLCNGSLVIGCCCCCCAVCAWWWWWWWWTMWTAWGRAAVVVIWVVVGAKPLPPLTPPLPPTTDEAAATAATARLGITGA